MAGNLRNRGSAPQGNATDMLTALVGCLILILMSVMMVALALDGVRAQEKSLAKGDVSTLLHAFPSQGFVEHRALPPVEIASNPVVVDVQGDTVSVHFADGNVEPYSCLDAVLPEKGLQKIFLEPDQNGKPRYVVFFIRPTGVVLGRKLRALAEEAGCAIGYELIRSDAAISVSKAQDARLESKVQTPGKSPRGEGSHG